MQLPSRLHTALRQPTVWVFFGIILVLTLWLASGMLQPRTTASAPTPERVQRVAVTWSEAQPVTREISAYGDVEPSQTSRLRARTDGIIEDMVSVGTEVSRGETLGTLSMDDREVRQAQASARVVSQESDYQGVLRLREQGLSSQSEEQARLAELEAARAELRRINFEIENTDLTAPISGVVNRVIADTGAYVSPGGEVVEIVNNDPLLAVVNVQQRVVHEVHEGMAAQIRFLGGASREGTVQFVAPVANANTRTFRVEIAVPNPSPRLPAGMSVEVVLPIGEVQAHKISPALTRLDDQGRAGVFTVDDDERARFHPIDIVRATATGIYVTGLPERARLVTISQGLSDGQRVEAAAAPVEFSNGPEAH